MKKRHFLCPVLSAVIILLCIIFTTPVSAAGIDSNQPSSPSLNKTSTKDNASGLTKARKAEVIKTYGKLSLYFIENKGQVDGQVRFYERGGGHTTFFTGDGVVLALTKSGSRVEKTSHNKRTKDGERKNDKEAITEALSLSFVGANKDAKITAEGRMPGHVNYFIGNDRSKWHSNIPTYEAVTYKDLYKNIDISFYGNNKDLEHDVIVRPGGDPSSVRLAYKGIKGLKITEDGDLEVSLEHGKIIEKRPLIYQEIEGRRVAVEGGYRILSDKDGAFAYGFEVASYDMTKDVVLDPVLEYSTYLGGSYDVTGSEGIAIDSAGAAYVTGYTASTDFPLVNPIQATQSGSYDAFVTKINPAGSAIVYSTYLGGSDYDYSYDISVDSAGNAYVTGYTASPDFPLINPLQDFLKGGSDAFVTKINSAGSAFYYSTYLGGNDYDYGQGISVDSAGNAYVTGLTPSSDFPIINPVQWAFGGGTEDAFVSKITPTGSALVYSTYLGGTDFDSGNSIAVDSTGAAYVTGSTTSPDFPLINPLQAILDGGSDAFITKINPTGSALVYSTYIGGMNFDLGHDIAVDNTGAAYVTGSTTSQDFPLLNPAQWIFGGIEDAFVTKITPTGSALVYSTYLGGSDLDEGFGIAVDSAGTAYVTGYTWSNDLPLVNPIQDVMGGAFDVFVTKINPSGSNLIYSTYLGGGASEIGNSIVVDSVGAAYVTGYTSSSDFPLMNPIQGTVAFGGTDAFISKISLSPLSVVTLVITPDATSVARGSTLGYNVTATNTTATKQCFNYWENVTLPGGSTYPPYGALFGPVHLCLLPRMLLSGHLAHGVPMNAPIGAYTFNAFTGVYPIAVVSEAHFNFNVTAFNPATKKPQRSWRLLENGFRK